MYLMLLSYFFYIITTTINTSLELNEENIEHIKINYKEYSEMKELNTNDSIYNKNIPFKKRKLNDNFELINYVENKNIPFKKRKFNENFELINNEKNKNILNKIFIEKETIEDKQAHCKNDKNKNYTSNFNINKEINLYRSYYEQINESNNNTFFTKSNFDLKNILQHKPNTIEQLFLNLKFLLREVTDVNYYGNSRIFIHFIKIINTDLLHTLKGYQYLILKNKDIEYYICKIEDNKSDIHEISIFIDVLKGILNLDIKNDFNPVKNIFITNILHTKYKNNLKNRNFY